MTWLTPHFSVEELTRSETAARKGLDNTPSAATVANLSKTAEYLELVREAVQAHYGQDKVVVITSGYRSPAVNEAVGGAPTSAHCFGCAADIHVPGISVLELAEFVAGQMHAYDQVIHEYGSWVHVGLPRPGAAPREQRLTIGRFSDGVRTLPGILPLPNRR